MELFKAVVKGDGEYGSQLMIQHSRAPPKWRKPDSKGIFNVIGSLMGRKICDWNGSFI